MANKKKFRCTNYGNGCPNADNNIEIELEELDILEGNIKCPHCKQELEEIPQKAPVNIKLLAGIVAAVIVLVVAGLLLFGGDSEKTSQTENKQETSLTTEREKPEDKVQVIPDDTEHATTITDGNGTMKLSYGVYSGDIKNGYPHGQGRLTYSKERQINRYDMKKRKASAGEYVIGEFQRGFFIQGRLYKANGELISSVMIGTAPGETYDEK